MVAYIYNLQENTLIIYMSVWSGLVCFGKQAVQSYNANF